MNAFRLYACINTHPNPLIKNLVTLDIPGTLLVALAQILQSPASKQSLNQNKQKINKRLISVINEWFLHSHCSCFIYYFISHTLIIVPSGTDCVYTLFDNK